MDAFIGEIRMMANKYAPEGWAYCNGDTLSIQQYQALFGVIGTTFGGDGKTSFKLPNLQGLAILGSTNGTKNGAPYPYGAKAGAETVTLTENQMPVHSHGANAINTVRAAEQVPGPTTVLAQGYAKDAGNTDKYRKMYDPSIDPSTLVALNGATLATSGGNTPHSNMQPYLVMNHFICLDGEFPMRP